MRRRQRRLRGEGEGEENVREKKKHKRKMNPRVKSLLKSLSLTQGTYYVGWELPTDLVSDQILSNFLQNSLARQEEDITSIGKFQPRNMGYILRQLTPSNRRSIFSTITKFSNFEFLLFLVLCTSVMSDNRHRI